MERITVTIEPGGDYTISVTGVKGKACQDITRDLERALGKTVSDTPTRERYETTHEAERVKA